MPFEVVKQNDYFLIKLIGECSSDEKPTIDKAFEEAFTGSQLKYIVFNCNECSTISEPFLRQMTLTYKAVKALNGGVRLVGANEAIKKLVERMGLDRIFVQKMSLRGALVDFGLAKAKEFDVNFINPFLNATIRVLKIQCFLEAAAEKPFIKKADDPLLLGDVSGIISVTSEAFSGTLAISLSETIFCKIASNMLGEKCETITEKNVDLVGELANIILGQAKLELGTLGYTVQMAIPSCVWGKDHKIKHYGGGTCVVIPFNTEVGKFYAEIMTNGSLGAQTGSKAA